MPNIYVLDKAVAELIAAGEVVERPASIVKETVENAVDAGATDVTVEIKGGGIRYIRITDNGCGIEREDIPRAFLRHATSKVRSAEDLAGIRTLGFRGEALASIAAMCRVELTTKAAGEPEGTTCRVEGGEMLDSYPAGCPNGTTLIVRDVFFNTPARMKFLKKDVSEGNAVAQVVEKCAMSHPEVAFRFIRDGQQKLRTSGSGDLAAVIRAVYGKELADEMVPVDYTYENRLRVHGCVSKPAGARPSRAYQNFFINGRYVRTRTASAALEEAFKNKLMGGRFPACALHLDLAADTVDVNVHPAKIEVRFTEEKPVFHAVYFGVKSALAAMEAPLEKPASPPVPEPARPVKPSRSGPFQQEPERMSAREFQVLFEGGDRSAFNRPVALHSSRLDISVDEDAAKQGEGAAQPVTIRPSQSDAAKYSKPGTKPAQLTTINKGLALEEHSDLSLRFIGEAFSTYILLEQGDDLVLVDKHAAHERILYEQLMENLSYGNRQVLLAPQAVTLAKEDYDALLSDMDRVEAMGFGVEDFGDGAILVRETPIELGEGDVAAVIGEIASRLRTGNRDLTPETLDRLYYSIACRGAVKAGDPNRPAELADLVERLKDNPEITHCPHGRPVAVRISRREVEKKFGRLG